jgi:hypothetical protein
MRASLKRQLCVAHDSADTLHQLIEALLGGLQLFSAGCGEHILRRVHDTSRVHALQPTCKGTIQQYTDYLFRFAGLTLHTQKDPGPNPLLAPLTTLLGSDSDLLHAPRIAKKWAELIRSVLPDGSELLKRVNSDYVAWNFHNRAEVFREHFGLVEIVHGRVTCYMFSKTGVTWPSRDQEVEPAA